MTQPKEPEAKDIIPANVAAQLDQHEKIIRTSIVGHRKGSAEQFLYALIAGQSIVAAKALLAHGNADPNGGLKKWISAKFPDFSYRTAARWAVFSLEFGEKVKALPKFKKRPLQLGNGEPSDKERSLILQLIPQVMDGKGMMEFMRDSKLLRDPEKQQHHPVKEVSAQEAAKAKAKQASRAWKGICTDLELWSKSANLLPREEKQATIDALVDAANKLRESLKRDKAGAEEKGSK